MIGRDELFALAALPIGKASIEAAEKAARAAKVPAKKIHKVVERATREAAKRASKVWLPAGKSSANTTIARDAERDLLARNYDIEDAIAEAGGRRGAVGRA
jgi:hypothetical protein